MCLCMHVCIYVRTYVRMYTYVRTYVCSVCMNVIMYVQYVCVLMYDQFICMYVHTYVRMNVQYVCMYACTVCLQHVFSISTQSPWFFRMIAMFVYAKVINVITKMQCFENQDWFVGDEMGCWLVKLLSGSGTTSCWNNDRMFSR